MTVVLTGEGLTLEQVLRVARAREPVAVSGDAVDRMRATCGVADRALERGDPVYGLTRGIGALKRFTVQPDDVFDFNRGIVSACAVSQGEDAPADVVRATILRLANGFAKGTGGVRPELTQRLVDALNRGEEPRVPMLGSVGAADLTPLGDLAFALTADFPLQGKEGVALVSNSAFSTALATLAVADLERLLDAADAAAALDLEAFAANLTFLHPAAGWSRPYAGVAITLERLRALLDGSPLWEPGAPRSLQDPLTFRCILQIHGAARDTLGFVRRQLAIELNASQENPLVLADEDRIISVGNSDPVHLAGCVDFLRIALAPVLTSASERLDKLLQEPLSGLPQNLAERSDGLDLALTEFGVVAHALTAEARLLAQPVSFELASTTRDQGLTDRMTMAPLGARRLAAMVGLGERIVALELLVAAQAVDLRAPASVGAGTEAVHRLVRERVPFTSSGDPPPRQLEPLRELVAGGVLSELGSRAAGDSGLAVR